MSKEMKELIEETNRILNECTIYEILINYFLGNITNKIQKDMVISFMIRSRYKYLIDFSVTPRYAQQKEIYEAYKDSGCLLIFSPDGTQSCALFRDGLESIKHRNE